MKDEPGGGGAPGGHARGHRLADHTFTHPDLTELSAAELRDEIRRTDDFIREVPGREPDCTRPPFGARDEQVLDLLDDEGHASALWSNDSRDWEPPGPEAIAERVLRDLSLGDVIIFHDGPPGSDRSQTVEALPAVLEGIAERGFDVVAFCHPPLATERSGGPTRIDTAVELSRRGHPDGAATAHLAVAGDFPDALAGAPAAAAADAPILLTHRDSLPWATRTELERLDPERLVVLGGEGAISDVVAQEAAGAAGAEATRLGGATRAETAAEIAARSHPDGADAVYLARADDFPDALAGGAAAAAAEDAPILLAGATELPEATAAALASLDPDVLVVLGGSAAIDASTADAAAEAAGASVTRVAGRERHATAAAIARRSHPETADLVVLATGEAFPDALTGSAYAGAAGAPLLLVTAGHVTSPSAEALRRLRSDRAVVVGGTAVISDAVQAAVARH